jgi:hypothetical protein
LIHNYCKVPNNSNNRVAHLFSRALYT